MAIALLAASCSSNGDASTSPDGTSTAVVITTTTVAAPTTSSTTVTATAPTTVPTSADTMDSAATIPPGTTAETTTPMTPPTTPPTTAAAVVGDPVVASEVVGVFDGPVGLAVRPGDDALFVVEQRGVIVRADDEQRSTVLDLVGRVAGGAEQGLLGAAFSLDGALGYVNFTDAAGTTTIAEYAVGPDGRFDTATERIVLTVDQPYSNHNAGDLAFGPDGLLYIPLGDGGSGGDPGRRASDPMSLLGSLLRIDPIPSTDAPYTIPPDNPFAGGSFRGVSGAPEVWAWGLRNPWKIAFDPITDELWIADVGQNSLEEVNVVSPVDGAAAGRGLDFGWSAFEGTERFNPDVDGDGTTMPVLTYRNPTDGCSVSGGVPYRGSAIADLEPAYVYSDYCSGRIWALDLAGGRNLTLLDGFTSVTAVRTGPDGETYVLEHGGEVHRLVPG